MYIFFRKLLVAFLLQCISGQPMAQSYLTRTGFIGFYSKTTLEDIQAENNQVYAALDPANHRIAFAALLKGFIFPRQLMQDHFNENYVESDKFPKVTFSGTCLGELNLNQQAIYQVVIKGILSLHGVNKALETTAQIEVKPEKVSGSAVFKLRPEDFQISIPGVVRDKIAREINVTVHIDWTTVKQ